MVTEQPVLTEPSMPADDEFTLEAERLTRSTINAFRAAFIIGGAVAVILGVALLIWPVRVVSVVAAVLGIYFIVTGLIRVALGIFTHGTSGGHRLLNILLGILMFVAGVIALRNLTTAAAALLVLVVVVIGVGWIIEGVITLVESRNATSRGWAITFGLISVVAGLMVITIPVGSALWLILFASVALIVLGIVGIIRGITFGARAQAAMADATGPIDLF
jgi:uncharacterized membrane protein HdeD (DUF308 family)